MSQRRAEVWRAEEKLAALLEYERLSEEERGKFLRGKGLHEAHLEKWKKEIIEGLKIKPFMGGKNDPQRKRIMALEKELRRKEAALAETAALLVLKKKLLRSGGRTGKRNSPAGQAEMPAVNPGSGGKRCTAVESLRGHRHHDENVSEMGQGHEQRRRQARGTQETGEHTQRRGDRADHRDCHCGSVSRSCSLVDCADSGGGRDLCGLGIQFLPSSKAGKSC